MQTNPNNRAECGKITLAQRRKTIHSVYMLSITATFGTIFLLGPPLQLFAIKLKCSDFYLGLMTFTMCMSSFFSIFGISIIEKYGKVRPLIICRLISQTISLGLVPLAFIARARSDSYNIILAAIIPVLLIRACVDGIGLSGWFPILQDNVPPRIRGSFFAGLRVAWQTAGLLANIILIFILGKEASFTTIGFVLLVGASSLIFSTVFLRNFSELAPNKNAAKVTIRKRFSDTMSSPRIRKFLLYIISYNIAAMLSTAFQIKYMKILGYSDSQTIAAMAMVSIGGIVSLKFWGSLADKYGNRSLFSLSHIGMGLFILIWLFVDKSTVSFIMIMITITARSIFNHGNGIAQTRYMLSVVPPDKQGMIVVINTFRNISIAIAPLLGGLLLMLTHDITFTIGQNEIGSYHLLFLTSSILMVVPHIMRKGFRESSDTPTSDVLLLLRRPTAHMLSYFVWTGSSKSTKK